MFNPKMYRDQVILPAQRHPTGQQDLERAARTINAATDDQEIEDALLSVDAARLFAVPDGCTDDEIARHLDQVAEFLKPGKPPITVGLAALLKAARTKHTSPNSSRVWRQKGQRKVEPPGRPSESDSARPSPDLYSVRRHLAVADLAKARDEFDEIETDDHGPDPSPLLRETRQSLAKAETAKAEALTAYRNAMADGDLDSAEAALRSALEIDRQDTALSRLLDQLPVPAPTDLQLSPGPNGEISLHWALSPRKTDLCYVVTRQGSAGPPTKLAELQRQREFTDPLPPIGQVRYSVSACRDSAGTGMSQPTTVDAYHAPQPTGVQVTPHESEAVVSWQRPARAVQVTARLLQGEEWKGPVHPDGSAIRLRNLQSGTTYRVALIAHYVDECSEPVQSEPIVIDVTPRGRPHPPSDFSVLATASDEANVLRVAWTPVPGHQVEVWSFPLSCEIFDGRPLTREVVERAGDHLATNATALTEGSDVCEILGPGAPRLYAALVWDEDRPLLSPVRPAASLPAPAQVKVTRMGDSITCSWHWPQGFGQVAARWKFVNGPWETRLIDRHTYQREGGLQIDAESPDALSAWISTVHFEAGQEFHSPPVEVNAPSRPPTVAYRLRLSSPPLGQRRAVVELTSNEYSGPAQLVAVLGLGRFLPANPADGEILSQFSVDFGAGPRQRITFPVPKVKGPHSLRVFSAVESLIWIEDPPTESLKG
ncbi:fibronectin type III domain-containing protein [Naumannella sp. ID2617S]|nr:fibronectin type III domain-containing protein [Naumannella sp. ID2617S]